MRPENFVDPIDFIRELNRTGVRYLLVGRQALVLYGAPLQSFDYDFYLEPVFEALKKIWKVARKFGMEVAPPPPAAPLKLTLFSDNLKVDMFRAEKYGIAPRKCLRFDEMFERKTVVRDKNFRVSVASLEDLKKSKLARMSPKDREDIKYIETLLKPR